MTDVDFHPFFYMFYKKVPMISLKIMMFVFFLAIVEVVREILAFVLAFVGNKKLEMTTTRKILLAVSIAFICTIIFTGFRL